MQNIGQILGLQFQNRIGSALLVGRKNLAKNQGVDSKEDEDGRPPLTGDHEGEYRVTGVTEGFLGSLS